MIVNFNKKYVIDIYKYNIYIHMCTYTWSIYTTLSNYTILVLHLTAIYSNAKGLATFLNNSWHSLYSAWSNLEIVLYTIFVLSCPIKLTGAYCTVSTFAPCSSNFSLLIWTKMTCIFLTWQLSTLITQKVYNTQLFFWSIF